MIKTTMIFLMQAMIVSILTIAIGSVVYLYYQEKQGNLDWSLNIEFESNE